MAVGTHHRGDLAVPQAGQSAAYFAATASIASTVGAGHGPSAGRRRGGGLVAASRFVRDPRECCKPRDRHAITPTRHVPLSGPRGRRRDSVEELRAFLPDPQLHRHLRHSQLQLLALVAQPPLGLRLPPSGPGSERSIPALPASTTGPASRPPSPRTPHADVLPRPATTRPSTRPTRPGSARPPTPPVTASAVCSPSHPSRPSTQPPAGKFDSLQVHPSARALRSCSPRPAFS
jgi:hypothetical protein